MESPLRVSDIHEIVSKIDESSVEIFSSNFDQWFSILIQPIEELSKTSGDNNRRRNESSSSSSSTLIPRAAAIGLCRLLPAASEFQSITKDLNALKIHRLLQATIQLPPWMDEWALILVNTCLEYFRDGCKKNFSKTIVPFVGRCLTNSSTEEQQQQERVRRRVAYAVALFPTVAGNTARSNVWNQQLNAVVQDFHGALVRLADPYSIHDDDDCAAPRQPATMKQRKRATDGGETILFYNQLFEDLRIDEETPEFWENRARFLIDLLGLMFAKSDGLIITLNVQHFVDLLNCLQGLVEKLRTPMPVFYDLLVSMIGIVGNRLLPTVGLTAAPFASSIVDGCLRLLRHCARTGPYSIVAAVYDLMASVAKYVGAASLSSFQRMATKSLEFTDDLLRSDVIAKETTRNTEATSMASASDSTKRKAQKRKAALMEEMGGEEIVVRARSSASIRLNDARKAHLRMWTSVLESGGGLLKSTDFRRLQQIVCRLLLQVQTGPTSSKRMGDRGYRTELYDVLSALVRCPHPSRPSVMQVAIRIFENGQRRENDPKMVEACRNGLSSCALMAKPRVPCFEAVLVVEENKDDDERMEEQESATRKQREPTPLEAPTVAKPAGRQAPATAPKEVSTSVQQQQRAPETSTAVESKSTIKRPPNGRDSIRPTPIEAHENVITIEESDDDESEENGYSNDGITCIGEVHQGEKKKEETTETRPEESEKELNAMLADFVDEPAEPTDIFIE